MKKTSLSILITCLVCNTCSTPASARFELPRQGQIPSDRLNIQEAPVLLACATCGCNELCPISVLDDTVGNKGGSTLTDSIWGNMILKMAYDRDSELQKYRKKLSLTNNTTSGALMGIAGGTVGQGISSLSTLNPPEGMTDSYAPGIVGLTLDVAANVTFGSRAVFGHGFKKAMRKRQLVVKGRVESILDHLEKSQTECAQAQKDLSEIIGERGARDCIQLWQSSHMLAESDPLKISNSVNETAVRKDELDLSVPVHAPLY